MPRWLADITTSRGPLPRLRFWGCFTPLAVVLVLGLMLVSRIWGPLMLPTRTGALSYAWAPQVFMLMTMPLIWRRLVDADVPVWLRVPVPLALALIPTGMWLHGAALARRSGGATQGLVDAVGDDPSGVAAVIALAPTTMMVDGIAMLSATLLAMLIWAMIALVLALVLFVLLLMPTAHPSTRPEG